MANDALTADLRGQLQEERDELRRRLAELGHGESGGLEYDPNFADSSQVTAERGEAEALAAALEESLEDVEAALEKIEAGTYGTCESCSNEIAEARLEAMPAARLCIECASRR